MLGNFIDMHCHIIPAVDDGSPDIVHSTAMVRDAIQEGVRAIITTPHYECGGKNVDLVTLGEIRDWLQDEASKVDKEFKIYEGHELLYSDSLLEHVKSKKALTLAKSRYVLIEFPIRVSYESMYQGMKNFVNAGYSPIIAHMERYECLKKDDALIEELIQLGCYFQMNSEGLMGSLLSLDMKRNKKLIASGYIHIIASDGHNMRMRPIRMKEVAEMITKKFGQEVADTLFIHNPNKIIENKYI